MVSGAARATFGGIDALKQVVAERNKAAHGARPHNRAEAAVRIADLGPTVMRAVECSEFLGGRRLGPGGECCASPAGQAVERPAAKGYG